MAVEALVGEVLGDSFRFPALPVPGPAFAPTGMLGATAASRYAGATTSGAPLTGTFAVGDWVVDRTGTIWICTTAGTPGTWTEVVGGSGSIPGGSASGDLGGTYPAPTVTATHLASALPIAQGGTAATTAQAAINGLTGSQSSGKYLRSNGTNASLSSLALADATGTLAVANGGTASTAGAGGVFLGATASIVPSATVSTYGTASTLTPGTGFAALLPTAVDVVTSSVGSETLTLQAVVTYSDASTNTWATLTITTSTTTTLTTVNLLALLTGGTGLKVSSIAWNIKSSISSSGAAAVVNVLGLNHN